MLQAAEPIAPGLGDFIGSATRRDLQRQIDRALPLAADAGSLRIFGSCPATYRQTRRIAIASRAGRRTLGRRGPGATGRAAVGAGAAGALGAGRLGVAEEPIDLVTGSGARTCRTLRSGRRNRLSGRRSNWSGRRSHRRGSDRSGNRRRREQHPPGPWTRQSRRAGSRTDWARAPRWGGRSRPGPGAAGVVQQRLGGLPSPGCTAAAGGATGAWVTSSPVAERMGGIWTWAWPGHAGRHLRPGSWAAAPAAQPPETKPAQAPRC